MQALQATTDELGGYPIMTCSMTPYAGPQCFPHLEQEERVQANRHGSVRVAGEDVVDRHAFHQFETCWLKCDGCGKLRFVDQECFAALRPEAFSKSCENHRGFDWGAWVAQAPDRYAAFKHRVAADDLNLFHHSIDKEEAGVLPDSFFTEIVPEHLRAAPRSDCASEVSGVSPDTSDGGSDDDQQVLEHYPGGALDEVCSLLGSRGGGLSEAQQRAQQFLLADE